MNLIVALVIASLVYIVQKRLYAKWWNRNLDVTISFEDTCVRERDESALTEVIYNGKFLPLPVFHVKFSADRSMCSLCLATGRSRGGFRFRLESGDCMAYRV